MELPNWSKFLILNSGWTWKEDTLFEIDSMLFKSKVHTSNGGLGGFTVKYFYGRQNRTRSVKRMISTSLSMLKEDQLGLNFGAGKTRLAKNVVNLDLEWTENVDIVSGGSLKTPFQESALHLLVCQEVLEHVDRPRDAIKEFHRILASDGVLLLQLPFIIGYHPGPTDFWRFTTEAYAKLLPSENWEILEKAITVGHGSALHRILVEFIAVHFSVFGKKVYRIAKGLAVLALFPLVFFDLILPILPERDRIAGGYIVRARPIKNSSESPNAIGKYKIE